MSSADAAVSPTEARSPAIAKTVHVVCSLFRPGRSLDRQIESILEQTHDDLRLVLRDDDTEGPTAQRITEWARRDARIEVAGGVDERMGTASSYGRLLEHVLSDGAEWIALADQDDEWHRDHLALSLEVAARHMRARPGVSEPLLVHGDLELIDARGDLLAPSFFAHTRVRHEGRDPLRVLVVQNFVTGCASVLNRPLAELAVPIIDAAIMHDWWLALCAASAGRILDRGRATVRYRQHEGNQIGARAYGDVVRDLGRRTFSLQRHSNEPLRETVLQARALRRRLRERADAHSSRASAERAATAAGFLDRYLELFRPGVSRLRRSFGLLQLGVGRQDRLLDLSLKSKLLTARIEVDGGGREDGRA